MYDSIASYCFLPVLGKSRLFKSYKNINYRFNLNMVKNKILEGG